MENTYTQIRVQKVNFRLQKKKEHTKKKHKKNREQQQQQRQFLHFGTIGRPPDFTSKSKQFSPLSAKTNVVGAQKNRLDETDLLSIQNTGLN